MPTEKELLEREIAKLSGKSGVTRTLPDEFLLYVYMLMTLHVGGWWSGVIAGNHRALSHGHPRQTIRGGRPASHHPYKPRGGGGSLGGGGNKTYRPGGNQTLVLNNPNAYQGVNEAGSSSSKSTAASSASALGGTFAAGVDGTAGKGKMEDGQERWVNSTSRNGNKSLVNPELFLKQQKARLARTTTPNTPSTSTSGSTSDRPHSKRSTRRQYETMVNDQGKRVVEVDGVVFEFEGDGKRLRRVEDPTTSQDNTQGSSPQTTPTRSSFSISGQHYLRTRNGNLVRRRASGQSQGMDKKLGGKEKKKKLCRYFTKTGACHRASTCPYVHDPNKISVCSKYLRNTCPLTESTCPVSHHPNPHNSPSCVHFQRSGQCRNGKDCLYPHVKVKDDAPVCLDLSTIGWCDRGPRCLERHAWECREYSEKGTCERAEKCELMHILRAKGPGAANAAVVGAKEGEGGEDGSMMGTVLPEDLVDTLQANGIGSGGSRGGPNEHEDDEGSGDEDDDDDDDDPSDSEASDHAMVDTEDEADDLAGQRDFISFERGE